MSENDPLRPVRRDLSHLTLPPVGAPRVPLHPVLTGLALAMLGIEALFWAGDQGWIMPLRWHAFANFAVGDTGVQGGPGVIWKLMVHPLLHANWLHVSMNTVVLVALGHVVQVQSGMRALLRTSRTSR